MQVDQLQHKLFTRRIALLGGAKALALSVLTARMYYLEVVQASRYATLADENRINMRLLPPRRGRIFDRHGRPLAVNRENFRAVVIREQARDVERTLDVLAEIIPIDEADRRRVMREAKSKRPFLPIAIRGDLSWEDVARIEVNAPDLPGVLIQEGHSRDYPHGEALAHLTGYVGPVSRSDLGNDPLLELPDFRVGKSGVERQYDLALRGTAGTSQVEVNAVGRVIRELRRDEGQPGRDLVLTLDYELQDFATRRLAEAQSAAAVVMDVHGGDILAMASVPSYDPNEFARGLSVKAWQTLLSNRLAPLSNKAISGQYAPGSTIKMVVALAALEAGIVSPRDTVFCPGYLILGTGKFHCWRRSGHGTVDMTTAIPQSCDVYFYEIAKRTGIDRIAAMARRFGLGERLGVDLPSEQPGLVPSRDWKLATIGQPWTLGETLIAGIGQGFMLSTPLQLAVMAARLANGGFAVTPRLLRRPEDASEAAAGEPRFAPVGVSEGSLRFIRDAMFRVVNHPSGTAFKARIAEKGLEMGGKTGTSQVRRIGKAERLTGVRKNEEIEWRFRDHALFVGYAPAKAPRYAAAVVVEHGGGGSTAAAPVVRDLLLETQRRDPVQMAARPTDRAGGGEG